MIAYISFLCALLAQEEDEDERTRIILTLIVIYFHTAQLERMRNQARVTLRLICASILLLRNDPSGAYAWQRSSIYYTIYWEATDIEFKQQFRMSRPAFEALVNDLSPWMKSGTSRNRKQNLCARMKIGVALYYFAHGGTGHNLAKISGLSKGTALKYVHQVAKLITTKVAHKWMGDGIFKTLPNYIEECRARFLIQAQQSLLRAWDDCQV